MSSTKVNTSYGVRPDKHSTDSISKLQPENGVIVFDTNENVNKFWNSERWVSISSTSAVGFIDYNDNTGEIDLTSDTWTDVPNNGAGAFTNKAYAPNGITELLDVSTGYLDFTELELGDSIQVRIDFKVNPNINNATLECRYVLGNGGGEYALTVFEKRLDRGSGIDYDANKGSFLIYMGDDNTRLNDGKLQVKLSSNGKLTNAGVAIQIFK
jgi:hypothetical protein